MKVYEIKPYSAIIENGNVINKYSIEYFGGEFDGLKEFYGLTLDNPQTEIKQGYSCKINVDNIDSYKKYIIDLIDNRSQNKIFEGFLFDDKRFSLSLSAQINWSNLLFLPQGFFPINLSAKDDDIYVLTYSNVQSFYNAALNGKNTPLQEGNVLKQQVKSCTTKEELDIIKNSL